MDQIQPVSGMYRLSASVVSFYVLICEAIRRMKESELILDIPSGSSSCVPSSRPTHAAHLRVASWPIEPLSSYRTKLTGTIFFIYACPCESLLPIPEDGLANNLHPYHPYHVHAAPSSITLTTATAKFNLRHEVPLSHRACEFPPVAAPEHI